MAKSYALEGSREPRPGHKRGIFDVLKGTFEEWKDDKASRHAAALAYYTALSIAPIVVVAIAVAGLVFGQDVARAEIMAQFQSFVGPQAAETFASMVDSAGERKVGIFASIAGAVVLLFAASGVFAELQQSLNTMWEVKPKPGLGIWAFIRKRFLSASLVLVIAFLMLVSLVFSAALAALGRFTTSLPGSEFLWQAVHFVVSLGVVTVLFAMMFKVLPDAKTRWKDVWIGALITAVLFTIGKLAIGLYIGKAGVASHYGAAGSVVVLLVWVYYSAQILFFGAEFTQVYANRYGKRIEPSEQAVPAGEESAPDVDAVSHGAVTQPALTVREKVETHPTPAPAMAAGPPRDATGPELIKRAVHDLREMVTVEVELAKREATKQAKQGLLASGVLGGGVVLGIVGLSMGLVALVLALGGGPVPPLVIAAFGLVAAGVLGFFGYKRVPKQLLPRTQRRIERDAREVKEDVMDLKDAVTH